MVKNNQSILLNTHSNSLCEIEKFIDDVCDQLFVNETYYGNILVSLTEFFNLLHSNKTDNTNISITYNSDYNKIYFTLSPISEDICLSLLAPISIEKVSDNETDKNLFLISNTVDNISLKNVDTLVFEYDISALHKKIYEERKKLLLDYFSVTKKENTSIAN